jgi:hypothetical protein
MDFVLNVGINIIVNYQKKHIYYYQKINFNKLKSLTEIENIIKDFIEEKKLNEKETE